LIIDTNVGWIDYLSGRTDEAIKRYSQRRNIFKEFPRFHLRFGFALIQSGKYQDALAEFEQAASLNYPDPLALACKGYVYAVLGKRDEAQRVWDDSRLTPYGRALICMGRRDKNGAVEWLEKAFEAHSSWMIYLKVDPLFAPLRSDRRYIDLLRRMKLEP
jgi:tetratricopeptide (TPR) repeat protein